MEASRRHWPVATCPVRVAQGWATISGVKGDPIHPERGAVDNSNQTFGYQAAVALIFIHSPLHQWRHE